VSLAFYDQSRRSDPRMLVADRPENLDEGFFSSFRYFSCHNLGKDPISLFLPCALHIFGYMLPRYFCDARMNNIREKTIKIPRSWSGCPSIQVSNSLSLRCLISSHLGIRSFPQLIAGTQTNSRRKNLPTPPLPLSRRATKVGVQL
jgi:hypothetical protein